MTMTTKYGTISIFSCGFFFKSINATRRFCTAFFPSGARRVHHQELPGAVGRRAGRGRARAGGGRAHAHLHPGPALGAGGALPHAGAPLLRRAVLPRHAAAEGLHCQGRTVPACRAGVYSKSKILPFEFTLVRYSH